jgi:hypothetical protein
MLDHALVQVLLVFRRGGILNLTVLRSTILGVACPNGGLANSAEATLLRVQSIDFPLNVVHTFGRRLPCAV